jgi:hypothetical protein
MLDTITYARWEACPIVSLHHHHHLLHRTLSLPLLSQIFFSIQSDHVEKNSFHAWCMKLSFYQVFIHPNGLRSSELCPFYSGAAVCPKLILDCKSLNIFAISPCTGLQIHRSSMRWNLNLTELLIFNFSSLNMSDQVLKIDENNDIRFWGLVTVMPGFAIPLGMTYLLLIYV